MVPEPSGPFRRFPEGLAGRAWRLARVDRATYWWVQLAVLAALTLLYAQGARRQQVPARLVAASALVVVSLHLLMR